MEELLQASFAPANAFASGLLIFVLMYWVTVLLGILDISALDIEVELDTDADASTSGDWLNGVLAFLNLGRVPLMFFLTFFALPLWVLSVGVNHALGSQASAVGFLLIVPLLVVCLFISKVLTTPFVKLFAAMEIEGESMKKIIGQTVTILLPADHAQIGQAAVKTKGSPVLLNVKTSQGHLVQKGETAVVIEYLPENNLYLIEPFPSL